MVLSGAVELPAPGRSAEMLVNAAAPAGISAPARVARLPFPGAGGSRRGQLGSRQPEEARRPQETQQDEPGGHHGA